MPPAQRLFGTNGVRFVPGVTRDLDFVIRLAESIGTYYGQGEVLLGRDGRVSSEAIADAAASGLMSSGRDVAEAGLVPTPALQFATRELGYRGGVMVTASHNPAQYNGLKVVAKDGVEIPRLDEQRVEKVFFEASQSKADWKSVGQAHPQQAVVRTYLAGILSRVNTRLIADRKFKLVMDLGNGAQCVSAPYLAESLGCRLTTINSIVDGNFPGRGPEPTPSTLGDLSSAVRATGADLGVAYDGDGDRAMFCDEDGRVLWGDQTGSLLADYLLEKNPGGELVTPVSTTQAIDIVAKKRGARIQRTTVGSVDVSRAILERRALFGFEENGGFIYSPHIPVRDGGMTTALVLECLAARGTSFSKAISYALPRFYQAKTKVEVDKKKVQGVMAAVEKQAKGDIERLDGLKVWVDDKTWVLVRPSGTEPLVRIFVEADSQAAADANLKKYLKIVKAYSA